MARRPIDVLRPWRRRLPRGSRRANFFPWYGGKGMLAAKVAAELPQGRIYVEPYAGSAAVLLRRAPAPVEVINDLDGEVANFYRVLRDRPRELLRRVAATPYARFAFVEALEAKGREADPVARAAYFLVRRCQGFAGKGQTPGNWGRSFGSARGMADRVSSWRGRIAAISALHDRISRAVIDGRCALEVMRYWDSPESVIYCDPPYVPRARRSTRDYDVEQDQAHHEALVATLLSLSGGAALSGYADPVYAPLERAGWRRIDWRTVCFAAGRTRGGRARGRGASRRHQPRTESLWLNPRARELRAEEASRERARPG